jgi:mono/diheme cytochrome c family protein
MSEQKDFHNQAGLLALLGSIVFVFAFFFYLVSINKGVDLAEKVSEPQKTSDVQFDLSSAKDPWVSTEQIVAAGAKLYKQNCAVCHGANGDLIGGIPNARNLIEGQWKAGGGHIGNYKVLQDGLMLDGKLSQMVSFKAQLKPFERWALVNFIESITKNKSKDKPEDVAKFAQSAD